MNAAEDSPVARFEQDLERLERIVEQLEKGELSLERSIDLFEQGMRLYRQCRFALETAEQRVNSILAEDGPPAIEGEARDRPRSPALGARDASAPRSAENELDDIS